MSYAQVCPVCKGRCFVEQGFYESVDTWTTSAMGKETCRSCGGRGYVMVSDEVCWRPYAPDGTSWVVDNTKVYYEFDLRTTSSG